VFMAEPVAGCSLQKAGDLTSFWSNSGALNACSFSGCAACFAFEAVAVVTAVFDWLAYGSFDSRFSSFGGSTLLSIVKSDLFLARAGL